MLAGRRDFDFLARIAALNRAVTVTLASLAAGGRLIFNHFAIRVAGFDYLVTKILFALRTGIAAKAVHRAGRLADDIAQLRNVVLRHELGFVDLLLVVALLAGTLGVALIRAGRSFDRIDKLVTLCRLSAFEAFFTDFFADSAGRHDSLRLLAVGRHQISIIPFVTKRLSRDLNITLRSAADSAELAMLTGFSAGRINVVFLEVMLAGRRDFDFLARIAALNRAVTVTLASLAAGGRLIFNHFAIRVAGFDYLVTKILFALRTGIAAKAVHRAGRLADDIAQLRNVVLRHELGFVDLLLVVALLAGTLGVALIRAGRSFDRIDKLVTLCRLSAFEAFFTDFFALSAGRHDALRLLAVGRHDNCLAPLVTESFTDFLNLAVHSAADFADTANLRGLSAGSRGVLLIDKLMLAGRGDFGLIGLFTANGADIVAIASLAAGNLLAFITDRIAILVAGLDGDVAQFLAAQLADGTAKTVLGAVRWADRSAQLGYVRVLVDREFLILFDLAAGLADLSFVALVLARRGNDLLFPVVRFRRLAAFDHLCDGFVASLAGVLDAIRTRAVGFLFRRLTQLVTQRLADGLNFSDQRAASLAIVSHSHGLRASSVRDGRLLALDMLEGRLLVFISSAQLAGLLHKTRVRAVRVFDGALGPLVRAARVRVRRERGQHGNEHTQRQYAGIYFPEFHSTTFLSLIPSIKSQLSR